MTDATLPDRGRALDAFRVQARIALADLANWYVQWGIQRWDAAQVAEATEQLARLQPRRVRYLPVREPAAPDFQRFGIAPYSESLLELNLLTTAGLGRIATILNLGTGNLISSTTARVGVGNGAGTAAIGDTDLSAAAGSANRWFNLCTVTTPSNVLTFASSFASGDGNFAWNEFGIDIGTATVTAASTVNAVLLNHKTSIAQGTKASGQVWAATATITIS